MENNHKFKDNSIKVLAVIGAIGILSFGGFLTITLFSNLPNIASGITAQVVNFTQRFIPAERIVVTVDEENPINGDIINLSFEHINKEEDGSYSFFYECREGIHLERDNEVIFCNTPYNFINEDNSLDLKVFSTNTERVEIPLSINFVENNSTRISERGKTTIVVNGDRGVASNGGTILLTDNRRNTGTGRIERIAGERVEETFLFDEVTEREPVFSDPNGYIDLKPKIIEVGEINRTTNVFTATSSISSGSRGAIKFEVENIGTKAVGSWTFNLVLPTVPRHIYYSKNQRPLLPGDRIEYVIGFDSVKNDGEPNIIIVNIDPVSSVREKDETNNIAKIELPVINTNN